MKQVRIGRRVRTPQQRAVRIAVLVGGALLPVTLVLAVVLGLGVSQGVGCGSCHAMGPYAAVGGDSSHSALGCQQCHAREGVTGILADGFRAMRWTGAAFVGRGVAGYTTDQSSCLRCHESVLVGTTVSRGIAVRHSDFIATPCGYCHEGTGHMIEGRTYRGPAMDDCLTCHKTSQSNLAGCEKCHPKVAERDRRETQTAWRVTHGPNWQTTHAMGNMATCSSCHPTEFCAKCHGVKLPHPPDWARAHGRGLDPVTRDSCATCHELSWCDTCHGGLSMPHPAGFMPDHGVLANDVGEQACNRCHEPMACTICHYQSSHPNVPGLSAPHGG